MNCNTACTHPGALQCPSYCAGAQSAHEGYKRYLDFPVLADEQVSRLEVSVQDGGLAHVQVQHALGCVQHHVDAPNPVQLLLQSLQIMLSLVSYAS